jgi:hypothetical protein
MSPDENYLKDLLFRIELADKQGNHDRRNPLVLMAVGSAVFFGYAAGFRIDPLEPDWPVAYIELPTGQVSWHLPQHTIPWDRHDTATKYARVGAYIGRAATQ